MSDIHQLTLTDQQYQDIRQLLAERQDLTEHMDEADLRLDPAANDQAEELAQVETALADWLAELLAALPEVDVPYTCETRLRCECGFTGSEHAFARPGHLRCPDCGRGEAHLADAEVIEEVNRA